MRKIKAKLWKRKVDKRMKDSGEIDDSKKVIRVNPRKGELINTIIHEELHKKHPKKAEKWVKRKAKKVEKRTSVKKAIKLLQKYKHPVNYFSA